MRRGRVYDRTRVSYPRVHLRDILAGGAVARASPSFSRPFLARALWISIHTVCIYTYIRRYILYINALLWCGFVCNKVSGRGNGDYMMDVIMRKQTTEIFHINKK